MISSWECDDKETCLSVGRRGASQPVVRHHQADVVVVAVCLRVIGLADGQDVILRRCVLGKIIVADDSTVSAGQRTTTISPNPALIHHGRIENVTHNHNSPPITSSETREPKQQFAVHGGGGVLVAVDQFEAILVLFFLHRWQKHNSHALICKFFF